MSRKIILSLCLLASFFVLSAVTLDGIVIDGAAGEPISGALLVLHHGMNENYETTTDEGGQFIFEDLETQNYSLNVTAEGYLPFMEMVDMEDNVTMTIELSTGENPGELTGHLFGVVSYEDGEPAAGLEMVISTFNQNSQPHHVEYETILGEDGSYDFPEILDFSDYDVMVMLPNMPFVTDIYVEGDTEFNFTLEDYIPGETYSLSGTVTNAETGEAIEGIALLLHGMQGMMQDAITDEAGNYLFPEVFEGVYNLTVSGWNSGYEQFTAEVELTEDTVLNIELVPVEQGELSLSGVVTDAETGDVLPGIMINLHAGPGMHYTAVSAEDGSYLIEGLFEGVYSLNAMDEEMLYMHFETELDIMEDTVFDIQMQTYPQGDLSLSGVVTDAETGEPIQGIVINLYAGPGMHFDTISTEDGSYLIEGLFEAVYSLNAMNVEMEYMHFQTEIEILEDTVFDIQMQAYVTGELVLSGTITSEETGEPLSDIMVHLFGENTPGNMLMGISDENGYYMIEGIVPGVYQLTIMGMQGMVLFEEEIEILENMTYDIVLGENQGGEASLSGVVINAETGEFIPGVTVFLTHGWETYETVSGEEGFYSFENISAGNYHVIAAMEGFLQFNEMITIDGDVVLEIVLMPFETGDYSLSGTITNAVTGDVISGVHVQIFGEPGQPGSDVTNEAGYYEISGLYEGVYQLMAWTNGWNQFEPFEATVEIFDNVVFDFELVPFELPGSGSVNGTVYDADTGDVIADAFLELSSIGGGNPGGGWWNHYNTVTDDNGNYNFDNVETGEYILSAEANGYLFSFFDGAANPEEATVIVIEEDSQFEADMNLTPLVFYAVSGTVMDYVNEVPLAEAAVRAMMPGTGCNQWAVVETITDEDGNYTMEVPQGDYIFVAEFGQQGPGGDMMRQFYDHKQSPANADVVAVVEDISGIDFDLAMQEDYDNSISGTITVDGVVPENPVLVAAVSGGGNHWEAACVTDMFGNYILENLPEGDYYILAYEYSSVPTYYPGVIDFQDAVAVDALGNVIDIDFELIMPETNGIYQANGYVLNNNNEPVANANVVILDENETVLGYAVTNNDGYYLVNGLPSGNLTGIATKVLYESDEEPVNMTTTGSADFVINPQTTTDVPEDDITPATITLSNYPNPFNPETTISFGLTEAGYTTLSIYNIAGQKIATLVQDELSAGTHNITWNGTTSNGANVASGMYFYRLQSGDYTMTNKMVLMK